MFKDKINDGDKRLFIILGLIILAFFYRLIPHLPNYSPIYTISVFSGLLVKNDKKNNILLLLIPILILFLTDLVLGIYSTMFLNYLIFMFISYVSFVVFNKVNYSNILVGTVLSIFGSLLFFIFSNFFVWLFDDMYSKNLNGLVFCYVNALPFLNNSILSAFVFSILIFGSYEVIERVVFKGKEVNNVE